MKVVKKYEEDGYCITEYDNGYVTKELVGIKVEKEKTIDINLEQLYLDLQYIKSLQEIQLGI